MSVDQPCPPSPLPTSLLEDTPVQEDPYPDPDLMMGSGRKATIDDIPEEVLIQIFELSLPNRPLSRPSALCQLRLTCQWWEQIIQESPRLWSTFCSGNGLKWMLLALDRAKKHTLTIELTGVSKRTAIYLLNRELRRIETLSVILPFRPYIHNASESFNNLHQPAPPSLRDLSISTIQPSTTVSDWVIFGGRWAHLRNLQVSRVHLKWSTCEFKHLERLDIQKTISLGPTLAQLLDTLNQCQDLQYLRLWRVGLKVEPSLTGKPVTLPKLTTFVIKCNQTSLVELFRRLRLPGCRHFEVREDNPSHWFLGSRSLALFLGSLASVIGERTAESDTAANTTLYSSMEQLLVLRYKLKPSSSAPPLSLNLRIQSVRQHELEEYQRLDPWGVLGGGGVIIRKGTSELEQIPSENDS
ncbi:hypothetical protein FRB90_004711 [Tulasnella sp. 427]|nr:hypothetical protein FRB90_004711 [Tulasnella sp. 427]